MEKPGGAGAQWGAHSWAYDALPKRKLGTTSKQKRQKKKVTCNV